MMGERGGKQEEKRRRVTWLEVENNVELTWGVGGFGSVMMGERGGNRRKNVVVESRNSKGEERRVDLGCRCLRGSYGRGTLFR